MKKLVLVFCLVLVIYCSNAFGQSKFSRDDRILNNSIQTTLDTCPVGPATNPFPENGATNIYPGSGNASWINGENTTSIEIYFGIEGNLVSVYSGLPISSYTLPSQLEYSTEYQWKVICKNDTCSAESETWSFTTGTEPGVLFSEHFNSLSKWTAIGPMGQTNWILSNWGFAGGEPPELKLNWSPVFNGSSRLISIPIQNSRGENWFSLSHAYWWYYNPTPTFGVAITYDSGLTSEMLWEFQPNQNIGGEIIGFRIPIQSVPYQLILFADGNSNNIEGWFVDDIRIDGCIDCISAPSNLRVIENWNNGPNAVLNWNDNSVESFFEIFRGGPDTNIVGSLIATIPENTTHFVDSTVQMDSIYSYRVRATLGPPAWSNFSNAALIEITIPVELTSFTSSVNENDVTLNWQTATETNNLGFEIQRLKNSKIEKLENWENIGFINGNGTTTEQQSYSFVDKELEAGKYQYRLKQIDFDGTFEYSNTIEVEVNAPLKFSLEQNYPNPFNPSTTIKFSIPAVGTRLALSVQLKVYDVLGKEIATLVNEEKPSGNYEVELDASKLASGIYYYQLKAGEFIQTKKMILIK